MFGALASLWVDWFIVAPLLAVKATEPAAKCVARHLDNSLERLENDVAEDYRRMVRCEDGWYR